MNQVRGGELHAGVLGYGWLGGFVGLRCDGVGGIFRLDGSFRVISSDALHAFFETAQTFAETFSELGELAAAESTTSTTATMMRCQG
jgi:hypothetical protein